MRDETMIEIDKAKPLTILSANLITAAVTKPPRAPKIIIIITKLSMP